jgi:hypothetical protein
MFRPEGDKHIDGHSRGAQQPGDVAHEEFGILSAVHVGQVLAGQFEELLEAVDADEQVLPFAEPEGAGRTDEAGVVGPEHGGEIELSLKGQPGVVGFRVDVGQGEGEVLDGCDAGPELADLPGRATHAPESALQGGHQSRRHQGGLSGALRTHHADEAGRLHHAEQVLHLSLPAPEMGGLRPVKGMQAGKDGRQVEVRSNGHSCQTVRNVTYKIGKTRELGPFASR